MKIWFLSESRHLFSLLLSLLLASFIPVSSAVLVVVLESKEIPAFCTPLACSYDGSHVLKIQALIREESG